MKTLKAMTNPDLGTFRIEIDAIDDTILDLLKRRFEIVRAVGELKAQNGLEIVQSRRAEEVLDRVTKAAENKNIPPRLIRDFYASMIEEAHTIEFAIKDAHQ